MERIGTRAAAVPAAMTSVKLGSSSYLIWWWGLATILLRDLEGVGG